MTGSNQFTLGTSTPTEIVGPGNTGRRVLVQNLDATNAVYVGGSGVASTNGLQVAKASTSAEIFLGDGDSLYAIGAAGTPTVAVLVTGP